MQPSDYLFIIVLITVIATRLWLFLRPTASPRLQGFKLHHYMYGVVLVGISFLFSNLLIYGISFGLIIDELPLFIWYKNNDFHWKEYNSIYARVGIFVCLIILFLFKKQFLPNF